MAGFRPDTIQSASVIYDSDDVVVVPIRSPEEWPLSILTRMSGSDPAALRATATGDLFVAVRDRSSNQGRILLLEGTNWSGRAGEIHEFVPRLDDPRGLEWDGQWLYVVDPPRLIAVRDSDGDRIADEDRVLVEGLRDTRGVTLGIDGWLYLAIAKGGIQEAQGTDGSTIHLREGGVLRVRPDGSNFHVFSRGTHGIEQVLVTPTLETIAVGAANEAIGWESRVHHLTGLDHHGYPLLFENFAEEVMPPISKKPTGSGGPITLFFAEKETGRSILTANVDSGTIWQRKIKPDPASSLFRETENRQLIEIEAPAGIDTDAKGHLFLLGGEDAMVADFQPPDINPAPEIPTIDATTPTASLIGLFQQPAKVRRQAQQEILRRSLTNADLDALEGLASRKDADLPPRIAALFTMKLAFGNAANLRLSKFGEDPDLLPFVLRALGDFPDQKKDLPTALLAEALKSGDLRTQREAILAVARLKPKDHFTDLARLAVSEDPVIAHMAINALVELRDIDASFEVLDEFENYKIWPGVFRSLARIHDLAMVNGLTSRLEKTDSSLFRAGAIRTLARLYHREGEWNGEPLSERPDTQGPYHAPKTWEGTALIDAAIRKALRDKRVNKTFLFREISRNRIPYDDFKSLLSITAVTPDLEEPTVALLLEQNEPPLDSLPFLTYIATSETHPDDLRLRAAITLARSSDDMAAQSAFLLTLERETIGGTPQLRDQLLTTVLTNEAHDQRHDWLLEEAHGSDDEAGILAWKILLAMEQSGDSLGTPARAEIRNAIGRASRNQPVLRRLLVAIAVVEWKRGADLVREALNHSDAAIASAAAKAAGILELDSGSE